MENWIGVTIYIVDDKDLDTVRNKVTKALLSIDEIEDFEYEDE